MRAVAGLLVGNIAHLIKIVISLSHGFASCSVLLSAVRCVACCSSSVARALISAVICS
jgi:hypothetical protein